MTATATSPASVGSSTRVRDRSDQLLLWASALFTFAVIVHGFDHARRGADSISTDVLVAGTLAVVPEVGVVVLALARHRLAPLAAVAIGASLAPAYVLVHFLPERSWLSDPLTSGIDVSPLSWIAASLEVVAAATLGAIGYVVLRRRGGLASATEDRPEQTSLQAALRHPLAAAFVLANAVILVITAIQL